MVVGQLNHQRANVFYFLCCTHATNRIEDAHTKAMRNFDTRLVCRRKTYLNFFFAKMKPINGQPAKKKWWGWGAEREKKKRKGEDAKDEIQCANNYFLKKVLT